MNKYDDENVDINKKESYDEFDYIDNLINYPDDYNYYIDDTIDGYYNYEEGE
jgi:hypothetical protein